MRTLIIFNPMAGQAATLQQELEGAAQVWRAAGWSVDMQPTQAAGDGTRLAREAAMAGYDLVAAAGGDGTINEIVNGLAGSETALTPLPIGTVNVWARELGLPMQPRATAEALLRGTIRRVDLGLAGERYFLLMAGVGFDAAVVMAVHAREKRRLGALAYVVRAVALAFAYGGTRAQITIDGDPLFGRVLMLVIGNTRLYGGVISITSEAIIDDGLLDVCLLRGRNWLRSLGQISSVLRRRQRADPQVEYRLAREVTISARRPLPIQVDGDYIGTTPMTFTIAPRALRVLLPERLPSNLLLTQTPESEQD